MIPKTLQEQILFIDRSTWEILEAIKKLANMCYLKYLLSDRSLSDLALEVALNAEKEQELLESGHIREDKKNRELFNWIKN